MKIAGMNQINARRQMVIQEWMIRLMIRDLKHQGIKTISHGDLCLVNLQNLMKVPCSTTLNRYSEIIRRLSVVQ